MNVQEEVAGGGAGGMVAGMVGEPATEPQGTKLAQGLRAAEGNVGGGGEW